MLARAAVPLVVRVRELRGADQHATDAQREHGPGGPLQNRRELPAPGGATPCPGLMTARVSRCNITQSFSLDVSHDGRARSRARRSSRQPADDLRCVVRRRRLPDASKPRSTAATTPQGRRRRSGRRAAAVRAATARARRRSAPGRAAALARRRPPIRGSLTARRFSPCAWVRAVQHHARRRQVCGGQRPAVISRARA